jgi:hypothetical protein
VPLAKLQSHVLRLLAAQRDLNSHIACGIALNHDGPRYSRDADAFHNSEERLAKAATEDADEITSAGFQFAWTQVLTGKRDAEVEGLGETIPLELSPRTKCRVSFAEPFGTSKRQPKCFGYVSA